MLLNGQILVNLLLNIKDHNMVTRLDQLLQRHGLPEDRLNTLLSNISESGVIIYDSGMMRVKSKKGSYIFPLNEKVCNPLRVAYGMAPL